MLIKFPFTDLLGSKLRPALVLFESGNDVIVAFITSVLSEKFIGDLFLARSNQNGLKRDSVLRLAKLATLNKDLIAGKIGSITMKELMEVNTVLREMLQV